MVGPSIFIPDAVDTLDRALHANLARLTLGISPVVLAMAFLDWLVHLGISPGKQAQLSEKAVRKVVRLGRYAAKCAVNPHTPACIEPLPQDRRFTSEAWQQWPFNLMYQSFLLTQQWWYNATTDVRGVAKHNENIVEFVSRQILDMFSPSNFPLANPEVLQTTFQETGTNLIRGWVNYVEDGQRAVSGEKPVGTDAFKAGKT